VEATAAWVAAGIAVAAVVVSIVVARNEGRARREAAQPRVSVDFRPDDRSAFMIRFVVQNTGASVATDVQISLDPPWESATPDFDDQPPTTFASIPPGRLVGWTVDTWVHRLGSDLPRTYTVTISAKGPAGPVTETYPLSLGDWDRAAVDPPGSLQGVAHAIDQLRSQMRQRRNLGG
jgi:hypothetical protein